MGGRGNPTTFDRLFSRPLNLSEGADGKPSVHELFSGYMNEQMSLRSFAEALLELHNVHITQSAVQLLLSPEATSGRVSFAQFQRALQVGSPADGFAGKANHYKDAASAIISDNGGTPVASSWAAAPFRQSDISNEPFIKAQHFAERSSHGPSGTKNPVRNTNDVSRGNPMILQAARADVREAADTYNAKDMANTAARMFISGELKAREFEEYLGRLGIPYHEDLQRMVQKHESGMGDAKFAELSRLLLRELDGAKQ